jgi:hypothetical protein
MTTHYIAWINNKETDSLSFGELMQMASQGILKDEMLVRETDAQNWFEWSQLKQSQNVAAPTAGASSVKISSVNSLENIRAYTAYPILRACFIVLFWANPVLGLIGIVATFFYSLNPWIYSAVIISTIVGMLGIAVSNAILDLVDKTLQKP